MSFSCTLFVAILVSLLLGYVYLIQIYSHWKKKKIPGPEPMFPFGNMAEVAMRKKAMRQLVTDHYFEYPNERFFGMFLGRRPVLVVRDPDDIKNVLIKDFPYFRNRNLLIDNSPISDNVFNANDDHWRILRHNLTPIFSSGKIKSMFPLMQQCVLQFQEYLSNLVSTNPTNEVRDIAVKFTLQFFSLCVLGLSVNTLTDEKCVYAEMAKRSVRPRLFVTVSQTVDLIFPGLIKALKIPQTNYETLNFIKQLVRATIEERSGKERIRKDFMDLLMDLKERGHITGEGLFENKHLDFEFTEMSMVAQTIVFFVAGFETSSSAIAFALYELALNPDIQEKTYDEIKQVTGKHAGLLTYESIQELKYLDMVMSETLRKYPLGGLLIREAAADYTFAETKFKVEKGTRIFIPIYGLHHDPKYYPDPEKFDPERFSPQNKSKINQFTNMPFGEGPRNCIAARFARTQTLVGVAGLLQRYRVVPSELTGDQLSFNPTSLTLQSAGGINLNILPR